MTPLRAVIIAPLVLAVLTHGGSTPTSELSALSDFYFSTGGNLSWIRTDGWSTLEGGGTPSDPCEWFGLTCTEEEDEDGHRWVTAVDLTLEDGRVSNPTPPQPPPQPHSRLARHNSGAADDPWP